VKRTGGDVLRIEGFKNPEELAAATRLMCLWAQGRLEDANKYETVRNGTLVEMAGACSWNDEETGTKFLSLPKIVKDINAKDNKEYKGVVPRSMLAFALFAYQFSFYERTWSFFDGITAAQGHTIEDWSKYGEGYENPVRLYWAKMEEKYDGLTRDRQDPHKKLRFRETDHFPEIAADLPDFARD